MLSKIKRLFFVLAALIVASTYLMPSAIYANEAVEFVIPDTVLTITGYASPGALVTIYDGSTIIGTVSAGSNAFFSKQFKSLRTGLHNINLEFIDKSGRKSPKVSDTISVAYHKETSSEYFLPPTFEVSPSSLTEGDIVRFQGSTVPGAQVEVAVDGGNTRLRPIADENGNYSVSLATDGFFFGKHPASAKSVFGGKTSSNSAKLAFDILPVESDKNNRNNNSNIQPPKIVSPISPFKTKLEEQTISGTAGPNQQIIIFIDGEPIGSTFSNANGEWYFEFKLYSQEHKIRAIACVNSECSDFSNSVEIKFTGDFSKCTDLRFSLEDYRFWGITAGGSIELTMSQLTGKPSYDMLIDWGDNNTERFTHDDSDGFNVQHIYQDMGNFNGNVVISDSRDCTFTRYFSASINPNKVKLVDLWWTVPGLVTVGFALALRYSKPQEDSKED